MSALNKINIVYMSVEGNTRHFVGMLSKMFHNVRLIEVTDQSDFCDFSQPYFCFVPTYIHGNHDRYVEVGTNTLHDMLAYHDNFKNCLGFVGSGNRNFGVDSFCWTARYYSELFHKPVVAQYELRGDGPTANRIDRKLAKLWNAKTSGHVSFQAHRLVNPRLKKLEQKYGNLD